MSDRVRVWCLRAASDVLTAREREVATLIGRGMTNREIANALVISIKPADTHADRLRDKLALRSRAEIAIRAVRNGLLNADSAAERSGHLWSERTGHQRRWQAVHARVPTSSVTNRWASWTNWAPP